MADGQNAEVINIKTLYELVKGIDAKVDMHQEMLAVLMHEAKKPPADCPRNKELHDAMRQSILNDAKLVDHERRLVLVERVVAVIMALEAVAVAILGKIAYDVISGAAQIMWK